MKSFAVMICLILVLSLSIVLAAAQSKATGVIQGQVLDTLGKPIDKAQVRVYSKNVLVREAHADARGEYELNELPERKLMITAWSLGFVTAKREIELKEGQKMKLNFVLKAGRLGDSETE